MYIRDFIRISCLVLALSGAAFGSGFTPPESAPIAGQKTPQELEGVGIHEHLGASVSASDLSFRDESGHPVKLSSYFGAGKPVLLTLVYYECPNLCNFLLNGLTESLKSLDWKPGQQFEIVTVSINPREHAELAAKKKASYLAAYGNPDAAAGWHFLTGDEDQIQKLARQVGFGYHYDPAAEQYAHSAAIFILTPEAKVSRYLYGIDFPARDLRLSLLEASNGKIGDVVDKILLYCFHYDPTTRKYSVLATRLMKAGGAGTLVVFGGFLAVFWRRQKKESDLHV